MKFLKCISHKKASPKSNVAVRKLKKTKHPKKKSKKHYEKPRRNRNSYIASSFNRNFYPSEQFPRRSFSSHDIIEAYESPNVLNNEAYIYNYNLETGRRTKSEPEMRAETAYADYLRYYQRQILELQLQNQARMKMMTNNTPLVMCDSNNNQALPHIHSRRQSQHYNNNNYSVNADGNQSVRMWNNNRNTMVGNDLAAAYGNNNNNNGEEYHLLSNPVLSTKTQQIPTQLLHMRRNNHQSNARFSYPHCFNHATNLFAKKIFSSSNTLNTKKLSQSHEKLGGNRHHHHRRSKSKNDRSAWDYQTVTLSRVPGFGFGIAVSGGKDNPHFANGDPSIAVSDVLASGPAEDKLLVNDRIITVNGISLENVEYATAVQVLRDSGNTVTLVVKRRIPQGLAPLLSPSHQHSLSLSSAGLTSNNGSQNQNKVVITKGSKKDDFGIVLGCKLYVKEISSKTREQLNANGYTLNEGDVITRIHNTNCNDALSIKEAKKIIDNCKDRLTISVMRGGGDGNPLPINNSNSGMQSPAYSHTAQVSNCSNIDDNFLSGGPSYSAQNLYVQPPTRIAGEEKSNLTPRGRSRNPLLTDISLQQLDRPATPPGGISHSRSRSGIDQELPRPPPPRNENDYYSTRRQIYDDDQSLRNKPSEPRYITFQKEGSVGIRLTGGNEVGIFVTAVQQGSPASVQGLVPGDKILKVNDMDMNGVTREEAVLFLLSLQDRIDLIVQYSKDEYDSVITTQRGDSFHIKTHFHYDTPSKGETPFKAGDVFRVVDTLYNGVVGAWQVIKVGRGHTETQRGVIPNKARAEELATAQFNATKKEINDSQSRVGFFRRRRTNHRRSKSLSRENWDDVVFSDSISKFPAYERVVLRHPGFVRPVCLFGPTSDVARERMMKEFPDKFTAPLQDDDKGSKCGIVRLSNIRDIMDRGKHALLDITPNAVDRLNYAQFYPIVIFLKADNKHVIKQLRQGVPKSAHKSSKKLLEQCQKLEKVWSHVFSSVIMLSEGDQWYRKVRDMIDQQQSGAVWMSETKVREYLDTKLV